MEPMTEKIVAQKLAGLQQAFAPFMEAIRLTPSFSGMAEDSIVADFFAGNPQELALPGFVEALKKWSEPRSKEWFAYKLSDPAAQKAAAESLTKETGVPVEPEDVALTRGAFGALTIVLQAVTDPGDEVIFLSPPWFFYEAMIIFAGATPVRTKIDPTTFDIDLAAVERAVTPRTRAIIINTPNNPTGRIYPPATLEKLAAILEEAGRRNGRPIYLISDESYSRILFDGNEFHSPGRFYPKTFLIHTYSKSALAPGQRLGYVAVPTSMPGREEIRQALLTVALVGGFGLPDAVMQYALPDIDLLSIDMAELQDKRDLMVGELGSMGYALHNPQATFYLLPKCPIEDDVAFARRLVDSGVLVLPGKAVEMPGYFRISITATMEMIEAALPVFKSAIQAD